MLISEHTFSYSWRVSWFCLLSKSCRADKSSKVTVLNDEGMQKRLEQSDLAYESSSATQTSLLVNLKHRLEGANSLIQAAASEVKALGSRIGLYANPRFG